MIFRIVEIKTIEETSYSVERSEDDGRHWKYAVDGRRESSVFFDKENAKKMYLFLVENDGNTSISRVIVQSDKVDKEKIQ
jgi:hypothetical protein